MKYYEKIHIVTNNNIIINSRDQTTEGVYTRGTYLHIIFLSELLKNSWSENLKIFTSRDFTFSQ